MRAPHRGRVWHGDRLVGHVREDGESHICFSYDRDWLDGSGFPISVSLPLWYGEDELKAHAWFTGLLPEGAARDQVRLRTGLQRVSDDMGLLLRIGGDCAGALSVLPDGVTPAEAAEPIREMTEDDIRSLVHFAGWPLPVPVRFALAGAQHKLAVIHGGDGKYAPPGYLRPSGHILKFETMKQICFAEHIATAMAGEAGLPVVKTDYLQAEYRDRTTPYLRMARYDRAIDAAGNVSLLHQEDMLQALRLHPMYKYQSQNGPSIRIIAELLRSEVMSPESDLASLADWQILNYLLGNWDGHAKNLSLLYKPGEEAPSLAPYYDIVSIEYLNVALRAQYDRSMAFAVGESHTPERVTRDDWEKMAVDLGLQPDRLLERLADLTRRLPGMAEQAVETFEVAHGKHQAYLQMLRMIRKRCGWVSRSVLAGRR